MLFVSEEEQDMLLDKKDTLMIERPEGLGSSPDFPISRLNWAFLDPRTRNAFFPEKETATGANTDKKKKILNTWYLLRIRGQGSDVRDQESGFRDS